MSRASISAVVRWRQATAQRYRKLRSVCGVFHTCHALPSAVDGLCFKTYVASRRFSAKACLPFLRVVRRPLSTLFNPNTVAKAGLKRYLPTCFSPPSFEQAAAQAMSQLSAAFDLVCMRRHMRIDACPASTYDSMVLHVICKASRNRLNFVLARIHDICHNW